MGEKNADVRAATPACFMVGEITLYPGPWSRLQGRRAFNVGFERSPSVGHRKDPPAGSGSVSPRQRSGAISAGRWSRGYRGERQGEWTSGSWAEATSQVGIPWQGPCYGLTGSPVSLAAQTHGKLLAAWTPHPPRRVHTARQTAGVGNSHCLLSLDWCSKQLGIRE